MDVSGRLGKTSRAQKTSRLLSRVLMFLLKYVRQAPSSTDSFTRTKTDSKHTKCDHKNRELLLLWGTFSTALLVVVTVSWNHGHWLSYRMWLHFSTFVAESSETYSRKRRTNLILEIPFRLVVSYKAEPVSCQQWCCRWLCSLHFMASLMSQQRPALTPPPWNLPHLCPGNQQERTMALSCGFKWKKVVLCGPLWN